MREKMFNRIAVMLLLLMVSGVFAIAQNTTSTIVGTVADAEDNLPGAIVKVTEIETGTVYTAVSNSKGQFRINGVQPGGPYRMEVSFVGHKKGVIKITRVNLGQTYSCDVTLETGNELQEVVVRSQAALRKTGGSENFTEETIDNLPSINRSMMDILAMSPYYLDAGVIGGRDDRMNNFSVDGANFNSNMGLDREKMPGGGTPFAIEALEDVQVVTSAFDVKNSNFMGATINAITKKGTNRFTGSAYHYYKDESLRGNKVDGEELTAPRGDIKRTIYGLTLGGPIIKDKLFFFVSAELENTPLEIHQWRCSEDGVEDGKNLISRVSLADAQRFANDLKTMYGWDAGSYTNFTGDNKFFRLMSRIDWNINDNHQLTLRYNQTNGKKDNAFASPGVGLNDARVGTLSMVFDGSNWKKIDNVYSLTAELNSRFGNTISNKLRGAFTFNDANNRECDAAFPNIEIMKTYDGDGKNHAYMSAGYDPHAWKNGINEKSWNITDDLNISLGDHYLTLGAGFESTVASNCYMKYGAGYYRYASYDDFVNKKAPVAFAMCWSLTGEERALSDVTYNRLSAYLQDEWQVSKRIRLLYGVRMDMPMYTNHRYENPSVADLDFNGTKLNTGEWPGNKMMIAPRVGFNYDLTKDGSLVLRGGTGIFTGRFPLIFFSKIQEGSGMLQTTVNISNAANALLPYLAGGVRTPQQVLTEIVPSLPDDLKTLFPTQPGAKNNLIAIDKNFKMPQTWKTTLALDWKMPLGFDNMFTLEGTYAKDFKALSIYDANIDMEKATAKRFEGPDNRYYYPGNVDMRIYPKIGYAYELKNTDKGYSANIMAQIKMRPLKNLDLMAAYTWTTAKSVNSLLSNQIENAVTNHHQVNGINFEQSSHPSYLHSPHRIIASAAYKVDYLDDNMSTRISVFYQGRKNGTYSYLYNGDMNNDGKGYDLIYIPASKDEMNFVENAIKNGPTFTPEQQKEAFWNFINQDPYLSKHKGEYAQAYGAYNPWFNRFDVRLTQEIKVKAGKSVNRLQLNFDILNFGNLLNSKWGCTKTAIAAAYQPLVVDTKNRVDANGVPQYKLSTYKDSDGNTKLIDHTFDVQRNNNNCWRMQIGVKYIFN